jgi:hypothetical protein
MKNQNYSNHARLVPAYHFIALLGSLILVIGSIVNLVNTSHEGLYSASLITFGSIILLFTTFYARVFSLKAQDRAIRAEENFRHYLLTKEPLPNELTIRQVIGLRFASDEEFPNLVKKAVKEKMTEKDIKKSVKTWRPDSYRV